MTAIVGNELSRYNIDIAALSETRFADTGDLTEHGTGYTYFWSGKKLTEPREAGVGFVIRTELVTRLETLPKGINDRLMTMRIPLIRNSHLTLISAYAPTMTYSDEGKEQFYLELSNTLDSMPKSDKLLILGDFKARVGNSLNTWPNVIGRHGIGKMNSNGLLLLSFCAEKGLIITNTLFEFPVIHKSTWMHPRSKHWHQIDFIIARRRDIKDMLITQAMRGADCLSDHILLRCRASFQLARKHRRQPSNIIKKKLDVRKLRNSGTREPFVDAITNSLQVVNTDGDDLETQWSTFKDTVFDTAKSVLGYSKRKQPDSSPSRGIQPIFSEEYVEREKRKTDTNTVMCSFPFIATFVFLLCTKILMDF